MTGRRRDDAEETDGPRRLRDSLAELSADLGLPEPDALAALTADWASVVGADLAPHCELHSLRDGVLRVTVDSAPLGTQLRYLEADVVERAATLVGPDVVREIRVRVQRPGGGRLVQ
jgi:predicted nucleic acid-binding Zn ribbon protein